MIKGFIPRLYQQTILDTCVKSNTLVVLPTGLGKTNIVVMLAAQRIKQYPESKIVVLAPTKPLIEQHRDTFLKHLDFPKEKFALFTGLVSPNKREQEFKQAQIIFSTPQGLQNDLLSKKISLREVSLLVFDEAHKSVGDYSYVFIAKRYSEEALFPRIIGLTASPGSDVEKIKEVCKNLFIEEVEIRTENDKDVLPYIQELKLEWIKVKLTDDFLTVKKYLEQCLKSKLIKIKQNSHSNFSSIDVPKSELLKLQAQLQAEIANGDKSPEILNSISLLAEAMKVHHALELLETQGLDPLFKYMENIVNDYSRTTVKAVKNLVNDDNFINAYKLIKNMYDARVLHPKINKLKEILNQEKYKKIIVFTQYRDTAVQIVDVLKSLGHKAEIFLGQQKKKETGMSQKQQKEILEKFRNSEFDILVSTSIGEEGLDIPQVDEVIFYEPVPSAIRTIQRRGRTARLEKGVVRILVTEKTRDESYMWSAHHKEKRMYRTLNELRKNFKIQNHDKTKKLDRFIQDEQEFSIIVDNREKSSNVLKLLADKNIKIEFKNLDIGDYVISKRVCIEFKTVQDFVDSIIDNRILPQVYALKNNYEKPLLIIQGEEDIYSQRKIHPNAIRGILAAITVNFAVPIIQFKTPYETSEFIHTLLKREAEFTKTGPQLHSGKPFSFNEQQEFIVSSFPGIGSILAKPLLEKFGSIKKIVCADEKKLQEVEMIGPLKAKALFEIFNKEYSK